MAQLNSSSMLGAVGNLFFIAPNGFGLGEVCEALACAVGQIAYNVKVLPSGGALYHKC